MQYLSTTSSEYQDAEDNILIHLMFSNPMIGSMPGAGFHLTSPSIHFYYHDQSRPSRIGIMAENRCIGQQIKCSVYPYLLWRCDLISIVYCPER